MELENRQWIMKKRPDSEDLSSCFSLRSAKLRQPQENEILVKNRMLSFEPSQRVWMEHDSYIPAIPVGDVMRSVAVGEVVTSRSSGYREGDRVVGLLGWQDYLTTDGKGLMNLSRIPEGVSDSEALSIVGITGLTAYFGMTRIGKPGAGDTVVVSGAAGATGSVALQIAKLHGAKTVGIAGSEEKCRWLRDVAGADAAVNYRDVNISEALMELAPDGVNVYFDNVGGELSDQVLSRLAHRARIVLCGAISGYNKKEKPALKNYMNLIIMRARMEGFIVTDFADEFTGASLKLAEWARAGKIKTETDIQNGLEKAPGTLQRLFDGKNLGKQLLKI